MPDEKLTLDDDAKKLFEELGGIDSQDRKRDVDRVEASLSEALSEEESKLDQWRILMMEFASIFAGFLDHIHISDSSSTITRDINALMEILSKLTQMPNQNGEILIRYRGTAFEEDRTSARYDYIILFGNLWIDIPSVKTVADRQGLSASDLAIKATKAFDLFSSMSMNAIHFNLGSWSKKDIDRLGRTLHVLPPYFTTLAKEDRVSTSEGPPPVVYDENNRPDINLTMLAGLNRLNQKTIQGLIEKVNSMMDHPTLSSQPNVYSALFSFKKIKQQLVKPPLEINNIRWLLTDKEHSPVSEGKAKFARTIASEYKGSMQQAAQVVHNVYGTDYGQIKTDALGARLDGLTDFINELEEGDKYKPIEDEVLKNVEDRLDMVSDDVMDDLPFEEDSIQVQTIKGERVWKQLHVTLSDLTDFFKKRVGTKKKIKAMMHHSIEFDEDDYETIARDFNLSIEDAKNLLKLLQSCFDENGHFLRRSFEENIPAFVKYKIKVFEFLWHYLKEVRYRKNRVAFLNALQLLIARMDQTQAAFRILLEDIFYSPDTVNFHDRNALILLNILIRKYNKELRHDVELTPEEVLLVWEGLNQEMVQLAVDFIELEQGKTYQKIRTVHKHLKEALEPKSADTDPMPIGYLFTLEREFYIFASLSGAITSHKIMQNAIKEYGDPDSEVYWLTKSKKYHNTILKLLHVMIRGLTRFKDRSDLSLFKSIQDREQDFMSTSFPHDLVKRSVEWLDSAIKTVDKKE